MSTSTENSHETQNPDETTADYLYRLLYEENLGTEELADALQSADFDPSDLVIAAADEAKRRKEDLTVDIDLDVVRDVLLEDTDEEMSDDELRAFLQGILDSEGFQKLLISEARYWFQNDETLSTAPNSNDQ